MLSFKHDSSIYLPLHPHPPFLTHSHTNHSNPVLTCPLSCCSAGPADDDAGDESVPAADPGAAEEAEEAGGEAALGGGEAAEA